MIIAPHFSNRFLGFSLYCRLLFPKVFFCYIRIYQNTDFQQWQTYRIVLRQNQLSWHLLLWSKVLLLIHVFTGCSSSTILYSWCVLWHFAANLWLDVCLVWMAIYAVNFCSNLKDLCPAFYNFSLLPCKKGCGGGAGSPFNNIHGGVLPAPRCQIKTKTNPLFLFFFPSFQYISASIFSGWRKRHKIILDSPKPT